jgi:hypothetical protein
VGGGEWVGGWVGREMGGRRDGWMGEWRERARGEYRFSSLVKQKTNCFVLYIAGERFFIYLFMM